MKVRIFIICVLLISSIFFMNDFLAIKAVAVKGSLLTLEKAVNEFLANNGGILPTAENWQSEIRPYFDASKKIEDLNYILNDKFASTNITEMPVGLVIFLEIKDYDKSRLIEKQTKLSYHDWIPFTGPKEIYVLVSNDVGVKAIKFDNMSALKWRNEESKSELDSTD